MEKDEKMKTTEASSGIDRRPYREPFELRVLVVDDGPDVCFLIRSVLAKNSIPSDHARNIATCLSKISSFNPTHIILDINLPDGNGLDALSLIKQRYPHIGVIMHSALDTRENREMAKQHKADGFLKKPLNKNHLLELLKGT
ncbi:MAG: hypothetical protein Kow0075_15290 [Salibacteraceae bacterium]